MQIKMKKEKEVNSSTFYRCSLYNSVVHWMFIEYVSRLHLCILAQNVYIIVCWCIGRFDLITTIVKTRPASRTGREKSTKAHTHTPPEIIIDEFDLQFKNDRVLSHFLLWHTIQLCTLKWARECVREGRGGLDKEKKKYIYTIRMNRKFWEHCFVFFIFVASTDFLSHWIIYWRWQSPIEFQIICCISSEGKRKIYVKWWEKMTIAY